MSRTNHARPTHDGVAIRAPKSARNLRTPRRTATRRAYVLAALAERI